MWWNCEAHQDRFDGKRLVVYDNERGKGDRRHLRTRGLTYRFVDVDTLLADFLRDVEAIK
jgi:hypothetical protein